MQSGLESLYQVTQVNITKLFFGVFDVTDKWGDQLWRLIILLQNVAIDNMFEFIRLSDLHGLQKSQRNLFEGFNCQILVETATYNRGLECLLNFLSQ